MGACAFHAATRPLPQILQIIRHLRADCRGHAHCSGALRSGRFPAVSAHNGAPMFGRFLGLAADLAIDLGTANTCVFVSGRGIVLNEPSVEAFNTALNRIEAAGSTARDMIGRTPRDLVSIRPLRDGVIADFEAAERMLT